MARGSRRWRCGLGEGLRVVGQGWWAVAHVTDLVGGAVLKKTGDAGLGVRARESAGSGCPSPA